MAESQLLFGHTPKNKVEDHVLLLYTSVTQQREYAPEFSLQKPIEALNYSYRSFDGEICCELALIAHDCVEKQSQEPKGVMTKERPRKHHARSVSHIMTAINDSYWCSLYVYNSYFNGFSDFNIS